MRRWNLLRKFDQKINNPKHSENERKLSSEKTEDVKSETEESLQFYDQTLYSIDHPQAKKQKKTQTPCYKKVEYIDIAKIEHNIDEINTDTYAKQSKKHTAYTDDLERRIDYILDQKKTK